MSSIDLCSIITFLQDLCRLDSAAKKAGQIGTKHVVPLFSKKKLFDHFDDQKKKKGRRHPFEKAGQTIKMRDGGTRVKKLAASRLKASKCTLGRLYEALRP